MAYIYKIFNDINSNLYIGETIRPLKKRWNQHLLKVNDNNSNGHLQLAMRKYGVENFHIELIEECDDKERFKREKYWIDYYDSYRNGYNSTMGGEGAALYDYEKIYDLWMDNLSVKQICNKLKCCSSTVQNALKRYGIEYLDYINRTFARPVIQYTISGNFVAKYNSANEAGRAIGLANGGNIIKCCRGLLKTSKGYIWKYEDDEISIEELVKKSKKKTTGKKVQQFTLDDILIKEYDSCEQAAREINKNSNVINRCARGERKTAYGYKWKYKEE